MLEARIIGCMRVREEGKAQKVVSYRAGDKTGGLDLEEFREISAVSLSASLGGMQSSRKTFSWAYVRMSFNTYKVNICAC